MEEIKNNVKIITDDEVLKVFVDDKEIKGIKELKLNIAKNKLRTLDIKLIISNIDIEVEANKIELPKDSPKTHW